MEKELLLEKRRYGLEETISNKEKELLAKGAPVQKIIGFIDFDDLKIKVNRDVLIPRYETQEIVNKALEYINKDSKVLDLGTGSGYIGLTIKQKTDATVVMSDISDEAIIQATENAKDNNLDIEIIKSDLFKDIKGQFDVIVSNPPYIPLNNSLDSSVMDYDPHTALFAGEDGNDVYKAFLSSYKPYLKEGGMIIFEMSNDNSKYLKSQGFEILKDINGKERIAIRKN